MSSDYFQTSLKKGYGRAQRDVFAREVRDGFDCWGDEVERFSNPTREVQVVGIEPSNPK